jgi:hypothetical protein
MSRIARIVVACLIGGVSACGGSQLSSSGTGGGSAGTGGAAGGPGGSGGAGGAGGATGCSGYAPGCFGLSDSVRQICDSDPFTNAKCTNGAWDCGGLIIEGGCTCSQPPWNPSCPRGTIPGTGGAGGTGGKAGGGGGAARAGGAGGG